MQMNVSQYRNGESQMENAKKGNGQPRKSGYTKDAKLAVNWRMGVR